MKTAFTITKIINIVALLFLMLGAYGYAITGLLQVIAALLFVRLFPRNKLIYVYFGLVITFFLIWDGEFDWVLALPLLLVVFLTYIIYNQKSKPPSFLEAEWRNLAIINYEVEPEILQEYLPKGTELDLWNGKCYVSLIGFMFENTKLLGCKIPYHGDFEEVNLRFYVKRLEQDQWKRGVVFIKEIVPKRALTFVANTFYKEHYQTLPMRHGIQAKNDGLEFTYQWQLNGVWNTLSVETAKKVSEIEIGSQAEFITEHYFGYTKYNENTTFEYEVRHPRWQQYEVINHSVAVDFESVYGKDFGFLKTQQPVSVFLALGSEISVENKKRINFKTKTS